MLGCENKIETLIAYKSSGKNNLYYNIIWHFKLKSKLRNNYNIFTGFLTYIWSLSEHSKSSDFINVTVALTLETKQPNTPNLLVWIQASKFSTDTQAGHVGSLKHMKLSNFHIKATASYYFPLKYNILRKKLENKIFSNKKKVVCRGDWQKS